MDIIFYKPTYRSKDIRYDEFGQKRPLLPPSKKSGGKKVLIPVNEYASCREGGGDIKVSFSIIICLFILL